MNAFVRGRLEASSWTGHAQTQKCWCLGKVYECHLPVYMCFVVSESCDRVIG